MNFEWNEREPIFLQIRERIVKLILTGGLTENEQLPSVRQIASDYAVNPITVMKACQLLVDDGIVEKRRGRGMFVMEKASGKLMDTERQKFLKEEWPRIWQRIEQLGLELNELVKAGDKTNG